MARPASRAIIEEQAAIRLLHSRLERFSRWAVPASKWKLGECAETPAANRLFRLLFTAARTASPEVGLRAWARRVLDAYDHILDALVEYRTGLVAQGASPPRFRDDRLEPAFARRLLGQLKKLRRARAKDWPGTLAKMLANPDNEPKLLTALWRAATSLRLLRERRTSKRRVIEVKIEGRWKRAGAEPWYLRLTTEPERFRSILDKAISSASSHKDSFDIRRRLGAIAKQPTAKKLRNLFDDLAARGENEAAVARYRFQVAGRTTGIFPHGLPADFVDRLAARPDQVKALAEAVREQIKRTANGSGRPEDRAIKRYADQVADAYQRMAGKTIGYTKGSDRAAVHKRGKVYGLAAHIMVAALKLADASVGSSQAQVQIERIRRELRPRR